MDSVATDRAVEGRSSTRYAKHVIHRPLLASRCLRLTTAVLCLARPVFAAGPSPSTLVAIRDGLKLEENAAGKLLVLDTMLAPSMGDCSSSSPCWPVEGGSEPMLPSISSQNSLSLLSRNAHGKVAFGNSGSMNTRKQLNFGVMDVLFAIDPSTFDFFHVVDGEPVPLPMPMALDASSRLPYGAKNNGIAQRVAENPELHGPEALPSNVKRSDVKTNLRRGALQLITSGAAHELEGELEPPIVLGGVLRPL